jgi:hypothetical protein
MSQIPQIHPMCSMQILQIDVGIRLVPQFLQDPLLYILGITLYAILVFLQVFLLILAYFDMYLSSVWVKSY